MAEPGIVLEGVWKKFRRGEVHDSLRDLIPALVARALGRAPRRSDLAEGDFWALKDISFEVGPGEALGIIGPNGAGKSTLLKVLNRILRPNRGRGLITGRVGALLEIAAGFHPDLTGRENIYLQGAIMGMRKRDIRRVFDDIVDFSGIPDFIDTPVKRYSSGMNARLGFSIAAHLDPDVLLIDEVLSVGDLDFQTRAFARLEALVRSSVPVVVVSHQLGRIANLCTRAILLRKGECVLSGTPAECIAHYVAGTRDDSQIHEGPLRINTLDVLSGPSVRSGSRVQLSVSGVVEEGRRVDDLMVFIRIRSAESGSVLFLTSTAEAGLTLAEPGDFEFQVSLQLNVGPGTYIVETLGADLQHELTGVITRVVVVEEGASFHGAVQMNAEMSRVS